MPSPNTIHIRREFDVLMRNQGSLAHTKPTPTRRAEPDSPDGPTHPAFDRMEEMKVKQLQEVRLIGGLIEFRPFD